MNQTSTEYDSKMTKDIIGHFFIRNQNSQFQLKMSHTLLCQNKKMPFTKLDLAMSTDERGEVKMTKSSTKYIYLVLRCQA